MAPARNSVKRARLTQAAAKLSYRHGFGKTTLAEIAEEAGVPPGNVYYYFKTKEEVGEAIVDARLQLARSLRESWEAKDRPKARLIASIQATADNAQALAAGGCCVGTLCTELRKDAGPLAKKAAVLLGEHLEWIEAQFRALGKDSEAHALAVHLLGALQGVSVLAHALRAPELVTAETSRLKDWIATL